MTSSSFQIYPDFFDSYEESKIKRKKIQTNSRYSNFTQTHFTAGDEEQFEKYRWVDGGNEKVPCVGLSNENFYIWQKYRNVDREATRNTFRYMFNKFKKGIFVKIKDQKMAVFLPFSKSGFTNEWHEKIDTSNFEKLAETVCVNEGYKFNSKRVNRNKDEWYGNNSLIRYEFPISENDSNIGNLKNMLEELCETENIPDIEFFINKRDFPILKSDDTEPYDNIWNSDKHPLVSHKYDKYAPILSMVTSENYADIPIPTHNDWSNIQAENGKWFEKSANTFGTTKEIIWNNKKPTAIFRGASTGSGVTTNTNKRLKLASLSHSYEKNNNDKIPLLNAGITSWNLRPRKIKGQKTLATIDIKNIGFGLKNFMNSHEQSCYKYIIHVEGHVSAFRLSEELSFGSVILKVDSKWKMWYEDKLIPHVHYIPVKSDLSDLMDMIKWCRENDKKCEEIASNCISFYNQHINKKNVFSYMKNLLTDLSVTMSMNPHPPINPVDFMLNLEKKYLNRYMNGKNSSIVIEKINSMPRVTRCHSVLEAIGEVVSFQIKNNIFESKERDIIFESTNTKVNLIKNGCFNVIVKNCIGEDKISQQKHEAFIGFSTINKLCRYIPNFAYTYGLENSGNNQYNLYGEYIHGPSLHQWLRSENFKISEFKLIISQLCLALQMAQQEHGFVHWDLTPWNVILWSAPSVAEIDYKISAEKSASIKAKRIPVIIDYGKSKTIYKNNHHGMMNIFSSSTIQDILTLVITSVKTIITKIIPKPLIQELIHMVNFFSGNKLRNMYDLKKFINNKGKYNDIVYSDKKDLEKYNPLDFIKYIDTEIKFKKSWVPFMQYGNSRQIVEYMVCETDEERVNTYINALKRIENTNINTTDEYEKLYFSILKNNMIKSISSYISNEDEKLLTVLDKIKITDIKMPLLELDNSRVVSSVNEYNFESFHGCFNKVVYNKSFQNLLELIHLSDPQQNIILSYNKLEILKYIANENTIKNLIF